MQLLNFVIPLALVIAPMGLVVGYIVYTRKRMNEKRKNPINVDLLRSPGESLTEQLESKSVDIDAYLTVLVVAPLFSYTFYLQSNQSVANAIIFAIVGLSFTLFFAYKLAQLAQVRSKLQLGYDAELAVGQELNSLMREGYFVFHDVHLNNSADDYNIDHVVIGASGVFAVETKGRSKLVQKGGKVEFKVKYDGTQLIFPNKVEIEPIEQAKRQAISLQKWLSAAVGESVEVKPVLAIPGWFTEGRGEVAIINGKNSAGYFNGARGQKLSDKLIIQIAHQLEQCSRNVKPQAYSNKKSQ